jgi:hypothetical protein
MVTRFQRMYRDEPQIALKSLGVEPPGDAPRTTVTGTSVPGRTE